VNVKKGDDGTMKLFKRPVDEYVVPMSREELSGYQRLRVETEATAAVAGAAQ